jgi:hypothetical protein
MKCRPIVCAAFAIAGTLTTAVLSTAALIPVNPQYPLIAYLNNAPTSLQYVPGTQIFSIDAQPTSMQFTSVETPRPITGVKGLKIRVQVNNSGVLVGGVSGDDLVISGTVQRVVGTVTNTFTGILLAGEVTQFGYQDVGTATDQYDLRFIVSITGGALSNFFKCGVIGVQVTSELSTFTGSFASAFQGRAKGNVGLEDITPPVVTCPPPIADDAHGSSIVKECNAHSGGQNGAYVTYPDPVATDNCTDSSELTYVYSPPSGSFFPLDPGNMSQSYTVTLTVTDPSGNSSSCTFVVTVKDDQAPAFDDNESPLIEPCTNPIVVGNDPGKCSAVVTLIKPTATDCCCDTVTITMSAVDQNNVVIPLTDLGNGMVQGTFPGGTNKVTTVAEDCNGNSTGSTCPVIVNDVEPPVIDCQDVVIVATNCTTVCPPHSSWHCGGSYGHHSSNCSPDRYGGCHQKVGCFVNDDDRGCGKRGGSWVRRKCNRFGHWWCDKDQDDCEPVTGIVVPMPNVSDNCDDEVDVTVNPPAGTPLGIGVTTVTVTAVDDAGNTSTCTYKVTVLSGIKVVFNCNLDDDNKADNIETDADIRNRFDVCDRVPVCVSLIDMCTGQDVTTALRYSVKVVLDVTERAGSFTDSVLYKEIDENPSTPPDDGTLMTYSYGKFCYTLNTKGYEKGTIYNTHFFRGDVRVYYNSNPSVLAGREDASLESTTYSSCYSCY